MPQVLFRQIKAKPANWQPFYAEIEATLEKTVKPNMIAWFNKIVASWKHRPMFKAKSRITRESMQIYVYPTGASAKIWQYVSGGTRGPYPIYPKKPGYPLKFRTGYKARTTTSGGYKGAGRAFGKIVRPMYVLKHPGIKARNFEKHIARWYAPTFRRTMKNAVARATRKARGG